MLIRLLTTGTLRRSTFLLEAPKEGGGSPAPKTLSLEEQLTAARADLTAAQSSLSAITSERDTARTDLASITSERDSLRSQFDSLTTSAHQLRLDLTSAQSSATTLTGERDTARTDLATSQGNVTRLESLCGVKGIDPKSAVPPASPAPAASSSAADFQARLAAASTTEERDIVLAEFSAAAQAGKIKS